MPVMQNTVDFTLVPWSNAVVEKVSADPGTATLGRIIYNTTGNQLKIGNGTSWVVVSNGTDAATLQGQNGAYYLARANHTGTQLANTVSNFDTQVRTSRLDQMAVPTASVSLNSQKITSLLDPTGAQDAASKAYVDAAINGLNWKGAPVRVVTTSALPTNTYSSGGKTLTATANGALPSIDGVTLVANDRLLVNAEATGSNNGIYTVTQVGTGGTPYILTRATDADVTAELPTGTAVVVSEGTANADTVWILTTNAPITLDTTSLSFSMLPTPNSLVAGTGLSRSGQTIALVTPVSIANGGTNASSAATARSNLGTIGRATGTLGDGSTTAIVVNPGLGSTDLIVQVYRVSDGVAVIPDITIGSATSVTFTFAVAPTSGQYRYVITG